MKLVLYFCVLILGHSAFAGSSGGFDDDDGPTARPSKPAAAVKPAPSKDFPKCPDYKNSAELAKDMFENILGVDEDFPFKIMEINPCTGSGNCTAMSLIKSRDGKIMIAQGNKAGPSKICQAGSNKVQMTVDSSFGEQVIVITKRTAKKVFVQVQGWSQFDNNYAVGVK